MALDTVGVRSRIVSHAESLGVFGQVCAYEPLSQPGSGLTYAVWVNELGPVPAGSGLASSTARLEFTGRVYMPADTEPPAAVDADVTGAVDQLVGAYSGDFQLGGSVRCVDLLGSYGAPLRARYGYLDWPSGPVYRMATLTIPIIINSVWTQVA
jgi:hypothetical protein